MDKTQQTLLKFPCQFNLKIMVDSSIDVEQEIKPIAIKHVQQGEIDYSQRASRTGKYLAITITFTALSKEHLDNLYQELLNHEKVLMAL